MRRSVHSAVLASFDEVVRLVEADGLTGNLVETDGIVQLSLFPTGGSRATSVQRQEVDRRLEEWSATLAEYFAAAIDLYAYFEQRPERSVACLAHIFGTHEGVDGSGPLETVEEELVNRVQESMDAVVEVFLVPDGESFSMNELTRLVFDPFPARLTIAIHGRVLES